MTVSTGDIASARTAASTAQGRAGELAAYEPSVADVIKQKALEAYGANQDIIKPLDVATQSYLTAPQVGREKFQDIFNPFSRERLTAQYTGNQSLPMLSLGSILGQRFGRIEDIMGAGTRAYQAQAGAAQNQANTAQNNYSNLFNEYQSQQQQEQQLWDRAFKEKQMAQSASGGTGGDGGGVGIGDIEALRRQFPWLFPQDGQTQGMPTEPKPTYTPRGAQKGAVSQGGEWVFLGSEYYPNDWTPVPEGYEVVGQ